MNSNVNDMPITYDFLKDWIAKKNVGLKYIDTKEHIVGTFAKLLPK